MIYPGYGSNKNSDAVSAPSLRWQPKTKNEQVLAANVLRVKTTFNSKIKEITLKLPVASQNLTSKTDTHEEHKLDGNTIGIIKTDTHEEHSLRNVLNVETHEANDSPEISDGHKIVRGIVDLKDRVTSLNLNKDDIPIIKEHALDAALKDIDALGTLWDKKPLPKAANKQLEPLKQEAKKDNSQEITKSDPHQDDQKEINKEMHPGNRHIHSSHADKDHSSSTIESGSDLEDLKQQLADLEAKLAAEVEEMAEDKAIFDSRLSKPSPIPMESTHEPAAANMPSQASQIKPSPHQAELDRLDADKQAQLYNPRLYNHGIIDDPEKVKTLLKDTVIRGKENGAALFCFSEHGRPMMYVKNRDGDILEKPLTSITKNEIKYCFDNNIRIVKPEPKVNTVNNEATAVKVKKSALSRFLSIFTTRRSFSWKAFKIG